MKIGPNVLLHILYDQYYENKKNVKCEDLSPNEYPDKVNYKICSMEFSDVFRVDYYFEDKGDDKHVPDKIFTFVKESSDVIWKKFREYTFLSFQYSFSTAFSYVDTNLPTGVACTRSYKKDVDTVYCDNFKLGYNVVFKYLQTDGEKKCVTESYINTMLDNGTINVVKSINETTGLPIRTLYDTDSNIVSNFHVDDDECYTYHLASEHYLNFYYIQDLFINYPEFFYANGYEYLGEYEIRGTPCFAYEKLIKNFNKKIAPKATSGEIHEFIGGNVNKLESDFAVVTHYYPKDKDFWLIKDENVTVPIRIEIHLFDNELLTCEKGNITMDITDLECNVDALEYFDQSKCFDYKNSKSDGKDIDGDFDFEKDVDDKKGYEYEFEPDEKDIHDEHEFEFKHDHKDFGEKHEYEFKHDHKDFGDEHEFEFKHDHKDFGDEHEFEFEHDHKDFGDEHEFEFKHDHKDFKKEEKQKDAGDFDFEKDVDEGYRYGKGYRYYKYDDEEKKNSKANDIDCEEFYEEGYQNGLKAGYDKAYEEGLEMGLKLGYEKCKVELKVEKNVCNCTETELDSEEHTRKFIFIETIHLHNGTIITREHHGPIDNETIITHE